jgi:hypothetical protein
MHGDLEIIEKQKEDLIESLESKTADYIHNSLLSVNKHCPKILKELQMKKDFLRTTTNDDIAASPAIIEYIGYLK